MATSPTQKEGAVDEIRKTRDTAARLANGDYTDDADHIRVLAGMIQKLAEQVERLTGDGAAVPASGADAGRTRAEADAEASVEEDQTPQNAPADPINDRT
jgi:hypothetical protein